ncbi:MAG: type II toxin-antitoxin system VapC family toxin [Actinomycetota bacterium]
MRIAIADRLVVDASVLVELLGPGPFRDDVAPLFDPRRTTEYWIPDLCPVEVANALRKRLVHDAAYTVEDLYQSVARVFRLGPTIVPATGFVLEAIRHARELSVYDAIYLVMAGSLGAPLCTLDRALASRSRRAGVVVLQPGTSAFRRWLAAP